ncbi:MAG: 2-oxoacid:acceptor oxidoreductase subunit alpha [Anaerolineae bacterium]
MTKNDMTFKMGGEAGQGVESTGAGFAKALARAGLRIFGLQDYMSRIRGGYNFFQVRVSEEVSYCHTDRVHLLMAFNQEAIEQHLDEMAEGGGIIFDPRLKVDQEGLKARGTQAFAVPLIQIAQEEGGNKIMMNTAAVGAAAGVTDLPLEYIAGVIEDNFGRKKGAAIAEANLKVAKAAYRFAQDNYAAGFEWKLEPVEAPERMVINGNHAICLGALAAGCRFISAYPMTPATSIIEWMSAHAAKFGIVTKQTEDEIAAINMAIGAAHVGARAMTATSGGGFSLMVEALGMAGMTETPLVVVEAQRVGPSTGMPTRTEQGDLLFVLHASQGEFPRIVLTPGTVEQCFEVGARAFNLAETYQCPVIILTDNFLANSLRSVDKEAFDFGAVEIDRGQFLTEEQLDQLDDGYKRHLITDSGISPRALPGHPKAVFTVTSDEHDEVGHMADEDPVNRIRQAQKRWRKMETARQEDMRGPEVYGPAEADMTFVSWGSTYGPVREAVDRLNAQGAKTNFLHFVDIWPFPEEKAGPLIESAKVLVAVENNMTGQLAQFIRTHTGRAVDHEVLRYDGRPFSPEYILAHLEEVNPHA